MRRDWGRDQVIEFILQLPVDSLLLDIIQALLELLEGASEEEQADARLPSACLSPEDIATLLRATPDPLFVLIWRMLYAAALRVSELVHLRVADVRHDVIFVRGGKGDFDRYALIDPATAELLAARNRDRAPEARPFEMTREWVWVRLKKWSTACGLRDKYLAVGQRLSPHTFRHSAATHCFLGGMTYEAVERMLGHGSQSTLPVYLHIPPEVLASRYQRAVEGRGPGLGSHRLVRSGRYPARQEVVDAILAQLPVAATLPEVLDFLSRWHIASVGVHTREHLEQIALECPLLETVSGFRLPFRIPFEELLNLVEATDSREGRLAAQVLTWTGVFHFELEQFRFSKINLEAGFIELDRRVVAVDPESMRQLMEWRTVHPGRDQVFTLNPGDVESLLQEAAERTGLAQSYRAVDRLFTPIALRHACATHLMERGLDLLALHAQLGNQSVATTEYYQFMAVGAWRELYRRCHPLASGRPAVQ